MYIYNITVACVYDQESYIHIEREGERERDSYIVSIMMVNSFCKLSCHVVFTTVLGSCSYVVVPITAYTF
jgi:hypothetical protein